MYEVNTLDRSEVDQVFRRRIDAEDKSLDLPCKAIEQDKLRNYDDFSESNFRANEFYKEVHTGSLYESRKDGDGLDLDGLNIDSDDDEFNFTFLNYTDRHRITKIEAYQIVGILARNSDYLITPMQSELYHKIDSDNDPEDDWAYQAIYSGTELFLQGCVDQHPDMDVMGWIPQLDLEYLEDFINLYEQYDVEAFVIDFHWQLPTRWDKVARIRYLMRRIASQRLHEDVLFYGINMRPGTYDDELECIPAADFAIVRMMIDIFGGNHTGPRIPSDQDVEEREGFRIYDPDISDYRNVEDLSELSEYWPEYSALDVETVIDKSGGSKRQRNRYESLVNSEIFESELTKLRWALDEGLEDHFFKNSTEAAEIHRAGEFVRDGFDDGLEAPVGEYT